MANGRNKSSKGDLGRDSGGFIALPWSVLDCPAYGRLSMHARALLLEVARQFVRDNNGRMLLSRAYMATRGWKSMDMLNKCKAELIEAGFIFQTVQGHRPNWASWYGVTWRLLDKLPGYDEGASLLFKRGAYQNGTSLNPSHGTSRAVIAPPHQYGNIAGEASNTATVNLTGTPGNDAPVAADVAVTTLEDTLATINLIATDVVNTSANLQFTIQTQTQTQYGSHVHPKSVNQPALTYILSSHILTR